jgi:hypothetical protein
MGKKREAYDAGYAAGRNVGFGIGYDAACAYDRREDALRFRDTEVAGSHVNEPAGMGKIWHEMVNGADPPTGPPYVHRVTADAEKVREETEAWAATIHEKSKTPPDTSWLTRDKGDK